MSVIYVQIPSFVSAFGIHIQTLILASVTSDKNIKKLYYRSKKHFIKLSKESIIRMFLTYCFNKVPTGVFSWAMERKWIPWGISVIRKWLADCQTPDRVCSHSLPQHRRSLIQISIDGWHLVEPLGSATSLVSQGDFIGDSGEYKQSSDFSLPVLISPQDFACHMSSVILTDIIQTVLECFLSNTNNNMHILATETEEQAVYFGQLIHPSYSILPPSHKKF